MIVDFSRLFQCLVILVSCIWVKSTTLFTNTIDSPFTSPFQSTFGSRLAVPTNLGLRQSANPGFSSLNPFTSSNLLRRRCPICDPSVESYCSEKLFHDSCCCHNPNNPYDQLPYECQYADCRFLHANSCREHKLITACCCIDLLLYRK